MNGAPRVALFTDSLLEVNGVARTCRMLEEYAHRRALPLLVVHAGPETGRKNVGSVERLSLRPGPLNLCLEDGLKFDLLFAGHLPLVMETLRAFRAEAVHLTGPSHVGFLGSLAAWRLRLPVVMSWHTNVHQYASCRLPAGVPPGLRRLIERWSWRALALYYRQARIVLAPNPEVGAALACAVGRPVRLMPRGVDCELFHPGRRDRSDRAFRVGYVGRLSPEKSVRRLRCVARALTAAGIDGFFIDVVGAGREQEWLRDHVPNVRLHGVLRGEALARAYANFDVFVFPSETDTYGNVLLEAMASGVPCVVIGRGGPASIVNDHVTGRVCRDVEEWTAAVVELARRSELRRKLGEAARRVAGRRSWDAVGGIVWDAYCYAMTSDSATRVEARCLA
ncbi:MAG: glycosyl transferase [Bryobacteraceae bacterium]|nr:MAG: glycosyl transferase [Bryobacteraceae bacterium]